MPHSGEKHGASSRSNNGSRSRSHSTASTNPNANPNSRTINNANNAGTAHSTTPVATRLKPNSTSLAIKVAFETSKQQQLLLEFQVKQAALQQARQVLQEINGSIEEPVLPVSYMQSGYITEASVRRVEQERVVSNLKIQVDELNRQYRAVNDWLRSVGALQHPVGQSTYGSKR